MEGIDVPFPERVAETVFAGNALLSINGSTPYQALYGRTPPLLPGIEVINGEGAIVPVTDRHVGRCREIACQAIIEGTARNKILRALNTRTLPAGETQQLALGDTVEYFRPQSTKDVSGWLGPAKVTNTSEMGRGVIKIKHKGAEMTCRAGDVRLNLEYLCFLSATFHSFQHSDSQAAAWSYIRGYLEISSPNSSIHLGWVFRKNVWSLTAVTVCISPSIAFLGTMSIVLD